MLKSAIVYFSGTGNTKHIATLIKSELEKQQIETDIFDISEFKKKPEKFEIKKYDIIGFGYSVHAFNAPRFMINAIKDVIPNGLNKKTYIFKTAGDTFMNAGSTHLIRKELQKKNFNVMYEQLFVMPANVLLNFDKRFIKQLYLIANTKTEEMVRNILNSNVSLQKNPFIQRISTRLFSYFQSKGAKLFGKGFHVNENCNLCMKCVKQCPSENIFIKDDRIEFDKKCTMCLKCIYGCPKNAIYRKSFGFFLIKDGYSQKRNQELINTCEIKPDFINEKTKGFFKHYKSYCGF